MGFIARTLIAALGLWLASALVSGIAIDSDGTLLLAALLLGVVNAVVRPLVVLLTLPITVLTLGLFLWFINAAMLWLVAALLGDFHIAGLGSALLGAFIIGATSWLASWYVGPRGRYDVLIVRRESDLSE